ncbi:bifunctional 2-polyprenyl-6-hydroxyphenol methylase/3-demethylubiquinol 3-O-methyltransferase UbiG [Roseibium sp. MMSF_3544]|uniref:class I SAM-dependent methyltransferase n=1 Tax=unclassified Roseibium TaxID=2629323 RepID=UPI00273DE2F7|nr:class I SAM-dependent methyltransferase [Roseibium sp. MMSF_3544]
MKKSKHLKTSSKLENKIQTLHSVNIAPTDVVPIIVFRASLAALELVKYFEQAGKSPARILDIGGGHGIHADFFKTAFPNAKIDIVDMTRNDSRVAFVGDYLDFNISERYDVIWSSHVLEHVRNTGLFLDKIYQDLRDGGIFCCTVPPHRNDRGILAHLTTWDPMLLIINLVRAGFDARDGRFARYRYNISGLVTRRDNRRETSDAKRMPELPRMRHTYVADFKYWNWHVKKLSNHSKLPRYDSLDAALEAYQSGSAYDQFFTVGAENLRNCYYFDSTRSLIMGVN